MDRLTIRQTSPDGVPFLRLGLAGELDVINVTKLTDIAVRGLEHGERHILLDLTGVVRCDNGSLYTILGIRHAANHAGGSLALIAASRPVRDALHRTGLRELLPFTSR